MDLVDRIIAYTQLTRDMLLANGIGEGKIEVSTYGIDTSEIVKASKNQDPSSTLRVGFIGTLAPHKGCDILIRALSLLTELDVTLAIHGDPGQYVPYAEELRALAAERLGGLNFVAPFRGRRSGGFSRRSTFWPCPPGGTRMPRVSSTKPSPPGCPCSRPTWEGCPRSWCRARMACCSGWKDRKTWRGNYGGWWRSRGYWRSCAPGSARSRPSRRTWTSWRGYTAGYGRSGG